MLRDITLGQYYPVDSLLHRLDPRTKLFGTLVYIVTLFIADNLWAYVAATIFLITAIKLSNVPVKFMVRGLKSIMFLLLLSVSFNLFLTPGTPIFKIGFLQMTWEGLRFAAFMAIRLVYLVMGSTILTLTTTPNQLTDGLEKSLGFLKKVGVPVHEVSMMMSIALRFIPILIEETDHHIGVGNSQVCLLLGRSARHFPDHGFLSVHDVVMGKSQHVVLTVGIDHAKGQLAMMIPAEDRIQAHVAQKIISPAGVPFEIKAKSVLFHRSGDAGPGS